MKSKLKNISKSEYVKEYILNKIDSNFYREGQMIESENKLSELLNVSRVTIRNALQDLVTAEILYKEKGRGTFVSIRPKYSEFQWGVGFSEELRKRGFVPSTKEATLELVKASTKIAEAMKVNVGDKVWKITRVRCGDHLPIFYAEEYYNYDQCQQLDLKIVNDSIYNYLKTKGIVLSFVDQKIEAVNANKKIAQKLDIQEGMALIKMDIIAYMKNGLPFNCGIQYYRTDQYKLVQSIYAKKRR